MLSYKEHKILEELEKNNLSEKCLNYATYPDFMYQSKWEEYKANIRLKSESKVEIKESKENELSKNEEEDLLTIGRLLDRKLIEKVRDITYDTEGTLPTRKILASMFKITDYGYNSILEYRQWYKFWIPTIVSIAAFILSILAFYN